MLKLDVFEKAYRLSLELHRLSMTFPPYEQQDLASQLRRASKSICANFVEGFGKNQSAKEKRRFAQIAQGSNDEVKLWLMYAKDLKYMGVNDFNRLTAAYEEIGRMLYGLIKKMGEGS